MEEQVAVLHGKLMGALERAGRDRKRIERAISRISDELKKRTGPKSSEWTEEYYLFLLEGFDQAIGLALGQAIEREEYEWAASLQSRKLEVECQLAMTDVEKV